MSSKLYVGGLPFETNDEELERVFEVSGTVSSAAVSTDKGSGRSKGFGFVEMSSEEEAQSAIANLNGTTMADRVIKVEVARTPDRNKDFADFLVRERSA
jgi:RNA recognition motif-containing protein